MQFSDRESCEFPTENNMFVQNFIFFLQIARNRKTIQSQILYLPDG